MGMIIHGIEGNDGRRIEMRNWAERQADETHERMQKRYVPIETHLPIPMQRIDLYEKLVDTRALDVVNMGLIGKARDPCWGITSKTPEPSDLAPPVLDIVPRPRSAPLDLSYLFPKK